ncbi:MAG TPA: AraC family transcriptional regulator [Pyrinomonadaceae bacterium]
METNGKFRSTKSSFTDCGSGSQKDIKDRWTPPLGRQLRRLQLSGFVLTESLYEPCSEIPAHAHAAPTVVLVVAGESVERINSVAHKVSPGSLIIRPAGETHSDRNGIKDVQLLTIEVKMNEDCPLFKLFAPVFARPTYLHGGVLTAMAQRIYRETKTRDSAAPIILEGLLLEMLGQASRSLHLPPSHVPLWLSQTKDLCHARFAEPLTLDEIAKVVGAHPTHLARAFKKHYATTVGEYIRRLRLDWAATQLANTNDSIADIAAAAGFYDQSHFSHHLKKQLGLSPLEFRTIKKNGSG